MSYVRVQCAAITAKGVPCSREVSHTGAEYCSQHAPLGLAYRPQGWYGMGCWNALSADQQSLLIERGVLPMGRKVPEGDRCDNGAEVAIETMHDDAPGPRFYCLDCALGYLTLLKFGAVPAEKSDGPRRLPDDARRALGWLEDEDEG